MRQHAHNCSVPLTKVDQQFSYASLGLAILSRKGRGERTGATAMFLFVTFHSEHLFPSAKISPDTIALQRR